MRQALKDLALGTAARLLMTAAPSVAERALRRADGWFALLPYLRVEVCRRFFGTHDGYAIEWTRDLWWGPASADFGTKKTEAMFDFARSPYAPLWDHLVSHVLPELPEGARLLDYGCSTGQWLFALQRHFPRLRYEGYDFNPAAIARARAVAGEGSGIVFHDDPAAVTGVVDVGLVCAVLYFNSEPEVREILEFLAPRTRRLVMLEPLEACPVRGDAPRPASRMLSQPALNHDYPRLLEACGFSVRSATAHPSAFKTLPVHARLVQRAFPQARVLPGKRPDRVLVSGVVDYAVIDAISGVAAGAREARAAVGAPSSAAAR
jgi:SAM-dependent methyltransferase